jgi:hypothetical protein
MLFVAISNSVPLSPIMVFSLSIWSSNARDIRRKGKVRWLAAYCFEVRSITMRDKSIALDIRGSFVVQTCNSNGSAKQGAIEDEAES